MVVQYILFPGRHHIVTRFQVNYLEKLQQQHPRAHIVWAVTSADHTGTQRNPIPGHRRLGMVEAVAQAAGMSSLVYLIPNRAPKADFVHYVLEEIRTQTSGRVAMTPNNTLVACSTPPLIDNYRNYGFTVETVELETNAMRPWDIVEQIIERGDAWRDDASLVEAIDPVALAYYQRYDIAHTIQSVYADPLISSDDGDITVSRDYASYRAAFEDSAWRKVRDIAPFVQPGRIIDVGCATGQAIKLLAAGQPALFESDFYGVEVARPLYEICQQRKANGEFGDANVFFYQRNIMQSELFDDASINTVITMALTHEIESYLGREELVAFLQRVYTMLAPGGVYINYDVVSPDNPDDMVYAQMNQDDGQPLPDDQPLINATPDQLRALSSAARLRQFAHDFRASEGEVHPITWQTINGISYAHVSRCLLYEFLAKKDYCDSWYSEMHERFCFFTHDEWRSALEAAGLVCGDGTRPVQNPWLIANRFAPAATVYTMNEAGALVPDEWSWTNTLLIAYKPVDA
ncbi:MAG: methyltransferase domain-containing protein [Candidatus Saccharibacteria bacterium]|nr:methyltransferase domain-containing protein [Candidatus Saccharibacteria bacterium]